MKRDFFYEEETEAALTAAHRAFHRDCLLLLAGLAVAIIFVVLLTGCARFHSEQIQTRIDGTKVESRQTILTFWDANSSVAKLRASTTEKTQGLTVGGYEAEATSTNVVDLVERIVGAAVSAAVKSSVPTP